MLDVNGKSASYCFSIRWFLYFEKPSQEINGSPDELLKSETRLVMKFYVDFLCFHLCSVGRNI